MNHLRASELCPLHHSYSCQCHPGSRRLRGFQAAVECVEDPHSPKGFREVCSRQELRRRKHVLLERNPVCFYCELRFTDYSEVELIHIEPKGMGGATRDDSWDNIALGHRLCNRLNGSKRPAESTQRESRVVE